MCVTLGTLQLIQLVPRTCYVRKIPCQRGDQLYWAAIMLRDCQTGCPGAAGHIVCWIRKTPPNPQGKKYPLVPPNVHPSVLSSRLPATNKPRSVSRLLINSTRRGKAWVLMLGMSVLGNSTTHLLEPQDTDREVRCWRRTRLCRKATYSTGHGKTNPTI